LVNLELKIPNLKLS